MNDHFTLLALGWIGIYAPVALGAIGAAIGCTIAGQAAIGAMMEVNSPIIDGGRNHPRSADPEASTSHA